MEEANYENSLVMADGQGEYVNRQTGKTGWWSAAFAPPHSILPPLLFIQYFLSVRMMLNIWERHKGEKSKTMPNFGKFTSSGVFRQKKISECGTEGYLESESSLCPSLHTWPKL